MDSLTYPETLVAGALLLVAVLLGNIRSWTAKRPWLDGIGASILALVVVVGAIAGTTKTCMPNLDWGILAGQMLLRGIFEVPIASVFVVPAFIFAVANFSSRTNAIVFGGFAAILIGSLLLKNGSIVMIIVVVAAVSGIGLLYRSFYWLRRFGVLVALATAVAVGVVIFSVTPFGRNDCWP